MRRRRASVIAFGCIVTVLPVGLADAQIPEPRRLNGREIRANFAGRDLTDGVHWSEYYRADGALLVDDMGRRETGRWEVRGNTLCRARKGADPMCAQVWISGDQIRFGQNDVPGPFAVSIRRHGDR